MSNPVKQLFHYFTGSLKELIDLSFVVKDRLVKKEICPVTEQLIADLARYGVDVSQQYKHVIDNNAIRHAYTQHGCLSEEMRGQIAITEKDIEQIPDILNSYEELFTHKNRRGQDVIVYSKSFTDGLSIYVEEVRVGRKELAMDTIYKRKNDKRTDANG